MTNTAGLLWYDSDPQRSLEDKVKRAATRFHEKYGAWPATCYIHREAGSAGQVQIGEAIVQIVPALFVLRHHMLLAWGNGT